MSIRDAFSLSRKVRVATRSRIFMMQWERLSLSKKHTQSALHMARGEAGLSFRKEALMTKPNDDGTATICASTAPHLPPDLQS